MTLSHNSKRKMAEPTKSDSSQDSDHEFDPSADMMVHDYDDERTLDEEEALSGSESIDNELDSLNREGDMPMEELMAMYGYGGQASHSVDPDSTSETNGTQSSSEEEVDAAVEKQAEGVEAAEGEPGTDREVVEEGVDTARLLRSADGQPASSDDDSEDIDYEPQMDEEWKKTISVGHSFQAVVPSGLSHYGDAPAYENEDRQLWDPVKLHCVDVEKFLGDVQKQNQQSAQGVQAIPTGDHIRDDEQALFLLLQCAHNTEEALRRRKMQAVPATDPMSLWSEEECRNFESGLRHYGKDFYLIQQHKVRTRSVGELVQFYYLWKKTDRHDVFANKNRLEKKKYALHPGITDYMDRFVDEQQELGVSGGRAEHSPNNIHSLLYGSVRHLKPPSSHPGPSHHLHRPPSHDTLKPPSTHDGVRPSSHEALNPSPDSLRTPLSHDDNGPPVAHEAVGLSTSQSMFPSFIPLPVTLPSESLPSTDTPTVPPLIPPSSTSSKSSPVSTFPIMNPDLNSVHKRSHDENDAPSAKQARICSDDSFVSSISQCSPCVNDKASDVCRLEDSPSCNSSAHVVSVTSHTSLASYSSGKSISDNVTKTALPSPSLESPFRNEGSSPPVVLTEFTAQ